MTDKARKQLMSRPDLAAIYDLIPSDVRVLDLGCGDGSFLYLLRKEKNVSGCGVEISQEKIMDCVRAGVPVVQLDLNEGLREFPDASFDFVVLSQTLQAVNRPDLLLDGMMRVGRNSVVSFINFGCLDVRLQLLFGGRMPVTETLPTPWFETPNIHLATVRDFRLLCRAKDISIVRQIPISSSNSFLARLMPNMFAPTCVFQIRK